jgi:hypothetical protein
VKFACWNTSASDFDAFRNRLGKIFKTVQHVRQAIGQDIISGDYQLYTVPPDKPFRTTGMEEAYGDSEKQGTVEPGNVLGTIALGLVKMIVSPDGSQETRSFVVLPKVVVDTSFGDILGIDSSSLTERSTSRSSSARHLLDGRD